MSVVRVLRLHAPLLAALIAALGVAALMGDQGWTVRAAVGWDAGVALFLTLAALRIARTDGVADIRDRAAELDQAGGWVLPLSLLAACASIGEVVLLAAGGSSRADATVAALSMATIGLSWTFVQTIFALHYAHAFYRPALTGEGVRGGLVFPGDPAPDYLDFLHFAVVIGVAAQTADIQIADKGLRRVITLHCLVSFLFNTVIVAMAVNTAVTLFQVAP